jgi:hypothetical protein
MAAYIERMNQYAADVVVSTTDAAGVIGRVGFDFGFLATAFAIYNDKATAVYLSLDSTTGSTGGFKVLAGGSYSFAVRTGGAALASTTTSTGDSCRVLALGM